jgi:hypothetical protein
MTIFFMFLKVQHLKFLIGMKIFFSFASNTGDAFAFKCQNGQLVSSDNKDLQVTATHSARNAGASRYREMLIETK